MIHLDPLSYKAYLIRTSASNVILKLDIEVLDGAPIDVLVLDENNYRIFQQQINQGYYQVDVIFGRQDTYSVRASVTLGSVEDYYLVIINMKLLESARVHIKAELESPSSLGAIVLLVLVGVIVLAVLYWRKIRK